MAALNGMGVVPIHKSYAGKVQDRISFCQIPGAYVHALVLRPTLAQTHYLQIFYNIHKLQEHVFMSAITSYNIRERSGPAGAESYGRHTMIDLAPLFWALACAGCWCRRGLLRLRILPIAGPILFHYIGAPDFRVSIGFRR